MKKFLGNNGYFIPLLIIVFSIALAVLIHWIVESYYPTWVFDTLMKRVPGYVLVNEKLDKSNLGEMYGPLNALFSGIGIIGLVATIFIQIYLYHDDKNTSRREKEDEEKDVLYYMWFKLNSFLTDIYETIDEGKVIVDKYRKMEHHGLASINLKRIEGETYKENIKYLEGLNIEKKHLLYLKYHNDKKFIEFFSLVKDGISKTGRIIYSTNELLQANKREAERDYCTKIQNLIISFNSNLRSSLVAETSDYNIELIKSHIDEYFGYSVMNKITFDELQSLAQFVLNTIEKFGDINYSICNDIYTMKHLFYYTKQDFYEKEATKLNKEFAKLSTFINDSQDFLDKIKSKSKIPKPV